MQSAEPQTRIMIVDDDRAIADNMAEVFSWHGWDARAVFSARAGIALARSFKPNIVIFEIMLEGTLDDGLVMLEVLRRTDHGKKAQAIIFSTCKTTALKGRAAALGVTQYLEKPQVYDAILGAIREAEKRISDP